MATQTFTTAAPDVSTFLGFLKWGIRVGVAKAAFGWVQGPDTGQVAWPATMAAITACSSAAGTSTYTYTSPVTLGNPLAVGSQIVITGMTNSGNNGTFRILTLPTSTTFTVANGAPGANESGSAGTGRVNVSVTITNSTGNGTTVTYTYTPNSVLFSAPNALHAGMSIVITGCTTGGFNGTFLITAATSTTFTVTNNTNTTEAETTAFGDVTTISALPGASTFVYEIWEMGDALQSTLPVIARVEYGETAATVSAAMGLTVGTSTDGAGNINSTGTTGRLPIFGNQITVNSTTTSPIDLSGGTNRFSCAFFHGSAQGNANANTGMYSIERAHDSSGNDLGTYFTVIAVQGAATGTTSTSANPKQVTVPVSGASTATESWWGCVISNAQVTGAFGNSTLVSPVFPMAGAVGNPLLGAVVGRKADFADNIVFSLTMYGVSHNYLTMGIANVGYQTVAPQCNGSGTTNQNYCVGMRFE